MKMTARGFWLSAGWADIELQSITIAAPVLLYQDLDLSHRVLRDFVGDDTDRIWVIAEIITWCDSRKIT